MPEPSYQQLRLPETKLQAKNRIHRNEEDLEDRIDLTSSLYAQNLQPLILILLRLLLRVNLPNKGELILNYFCNKANLQVLCV